MTAKPTTKYRVLGYTNDQQIMDVLSVRKPKPGQPQMHNVQVRHFGDKRMIFPYKAGSIASRRVAIRKARDWAKEHSVFRDFPRRWYDEDDVYD